MKTVSIIIVNYNGLSVLPKCLTTLYNQSYSKFEVIFVDNNSHDRSVEFVRKNFPKVKVVENEDNYGFAQGNNIGFAHAKGEYILLLNNDTILQDKNLIQVLVRYLDEHSKTGVLQPKIILHKEKKLQAGGSFLTWSGFLYHFGFNKDDKLPKYNKSMEVFSANGSCMMIRRKVIEKVGLFDEKYFTYFEESDFCWRVWLQGYTIMYIPDVFLYHIGAVTSKTFQSSFVYYHSFKNRVNSFIKNLNGANLFRILSLHLIMYQMITMFLIFKGQFSQAWSVEKSILWNIYVLNKTLKQRRQVQQKIRRTSDAEIFERVMKQVRPVYYYYLLTGLERYED